jgi:hypothetical protein
MARGPGNYWKETTSNTGNERAMCTSLRENPWELLTKGPENYGKETTSNTKY